METTAKADTDTSTSARLALAGVCLAMLLSSLGTSIANISLPALAKAFGASFPQVQWVVIAYLLAMTTLVVSAGRLGDIIGRRRLLLGGILLFTIASVLCGAAPTLGFLVAARGMQGIGAALMMALTAAVVGEVVPREKTGRIMGLLGTMSAFGTALGPSLGGMLLGRTGWHAVFLVNVPLGILAYVLVRLLPINAHVAKNAWAGLDIPGSLLLALLLAGYSLVMTFGFARTGFGVVLLMGLVLFVMIEARTASPLIQPQMFRNRELSTGLVVNALVATVMMATLVVGPFYLSRGLGLDATIVGLVMTAGPIIAIFSGIPSGRAVDRWGTHRTLITGLAGMTAGSSALAVLPGIFGVAGYISAMVILTPAYQLFMAANNTAVMVGAETKQRGVISGLLSLSRNLGLITGASLMGTVFALATGSHDAAMASPSAASAGLQVTFGVGTLLIATALMIAGARRR